MKPGFSKIFLINLDKTKKYLIFSEIGYDSVKYMTASGSYELIEIDIGVFTFDLTAIYEVVLLTTD